MHCERPDGHIPEPSYSVPAKLKVTVGVTGLRMNVKVVGRVVAMNVYVKGGLVLCSDGAREHRGRGA